jgi:hypothetical protein
MPNVPELDIVSKFCTEAILNGLTVAMLSTMDLKTRKKLLDRINFLILASHKR